MAGKISEVAPTLSFKTLEANAKIDFNFALTKDQRAKIATALDLIELPKMTIKGELRGFGKSDWELSGTIGASVIQPCVVTLKPVKSRIDENYRRLYVLNYQEPDADSVVEMDIDEDMEPLVEEIDLILLAQEVLALNLPDYPRADEASLDEAQFAAPGVKPMTDEDAKPFAGLAALKDKLENNGD